jgi:hypothetical protein
MLKEKIRKNRAVLAFAICLYACSFAYAEIEVAVKTDTTKNIDCTDGNTSRELALDRQISDSKVIDAFRVSNVSFTKNSKNDFFRIPRDKSCSEMTGKSGFQVCLVEGEMKHGPVVFDIPDSKQIFEYKTVSGNWGQNRFVFESKLGKMELRFNSFYGNEAPRLDTFCRELKGLGIHLNIPKDRLPSEESHVKREQPRRVS